MDCKINEFFEDLLMINSQRSVKSGSAVVTAGEEEDYAKGCHQRQGPGVVEVWPGCGGGDAGQGCGHKGLGAVGYEGLGYA